MSKLLLLEIRSHLNLWLRAAIMSCELRLETNLL